MGEKTIEVARFLQRAFRASGWAWLVVLACASTGCSSTEPESKGNVVAETPAAPDRPAAPWDSENDGGKEAEQQLQQRKAEAARRGYFSTDLLHCTTADAKLTLAARVYASKRGSKLLAITGTGRKMRELYDFTGKVQTLATTSSVRARPDRKSDLLADNDAQMTAVNSFNFKLQSGTLASTGDYPGAKVVRLAINEVVYSKSNSKGSIRLFFEPAGSGPAGWRHFTGCKVGAGIVHLKRSLPPG